MTSSVENNQQANFNPTWMKSAFNGGGGVSRVLGDASEEPDYPLCPPVFVQNRYGREDLLALVGKDSRPPDGLQRCDVLFVPPHQPPISIFPLSEQEQRLQSNINSSKAMSSLTPNERAQVMAGANSIVSGSGGVPGTGLARQMSAPGQQSAGSGGWTPVKTTPWRGGGVASRGGFGQGQTPRGGGTMQQASPAGAGVAEDGSSPYGQRFVVRNGRGSAPVGRGGSTTASFNTRAQGLYDPRDPKDRPRPRLRSTSEEDPSTPPVSSGGMTNGGWNRVGAVPPSIPTSNGWGGPPTHPSSAIRNSSESSQLPEWMQDDDEPTTLSRTSEERSGVNGSFDDSGQFKSDPERPPINPWMSRQESQSDRTSGHDTGKDTSNSHTPPQHSAAYPTGLDPAAAAQMAYARMMGITQHQQAPPPPPPAEPPKFFYKDPQGVERGPFERDQMEAWFKLGYFESHLEVRRDSDGNYTPLNELMRVNGPMTPFSFKEDTPPVVPTFSSYPFGQSTGMGGIWNGSSQHPLDGFSSPFHSANNSAFDNVMMERRRMEEENRKLQEETARMREMKRLEMERDAERMRAFKEKEDALRNYQEELRRRELQIHETAKEMESRLEMERLQLEEKARLVEQDRRGKLEAENRAKEEERRQLEERERVAREESERKKMEEMEKKKKEEEVVRRKHAEAAAEAERKRLEAAAKQATEQLKAKEEADRKKKAAQEAEAARQAAEEADKFVVTEEYQMVGKPKREDKKTQKAAPWAPPTAPREKTMREILEEEERQAAVEKARIDAQKREEMKQKSFVSSGTWNNAAQRLAQSAHQGKSSGGSVWASVEPSRTISNPFFDGPSLAAANRVAEKPSLKKSVPAPVKTVQKKAAAVPSTVSFKQWALQKMKNLNETVDADVLYSFVADINNPNEVEDYLVGYLGESKAVKEFVKEFLKKRSDSRGGAKGKDVESSSRVAEGASEWSTPSQAGKKKKRGGKVLVVDGACLGFTPAGDPNRTNKGEIETVGLLPGQRR